jgi:Zn-dependent protease
VASVFSARRPARGISPVFVALVLVTIAGGALTLVGTRVAVTAGVVVLVLAGWAVSLCLHEFSHALVADRCGDHTVRGQGYLTLDIRRYANVGLTFVLPLLFLLIGGIPLPGGAVWIRRGLLRSRAAASAVAAAGPLMNLLLAFLISLLVPLVPPLLGAGLSFLALIQVLAFILNVLPIPGLDGWGIIDPYLPEHTRLAVSRFAPYAPLVLFAVLVFLRPVASALFGLASLVYGAVGGDSTLAGLGQELFFFWQR